MDNETPDQACERLAEAHRREHEHTVYVMAGYGWVCEVCDEDAEEIVDAYARGDA